MPCLALAISLVTGQLRRDLEHARRLETDPRQTAQARVRGVRHPVADRQVVPRDAMRLELGRQPVMRGVGFCHHQKARGVLVDAMHDTGALFAADPGQVAAEMMQERIDQRARGRAGGGVDDHAQRLVDHDQVSVLVQDFQRDVLGPGVDLDRFLDRDLDQIALGGFRPRIRRHRAVHPDRALREQARKARAAQARRLWHIARQCLIKPLARLRADMDRDDLWRRA